MGDVALQLGVGQGDVEGRRVRGTFGRTAVAGVQPDLEPDGREESGQREHEHGEEQQEGDDVAAASLVKKIGKP